MDQSLKMFLYELFKCVDMDDYQSTIITDNIRFHKTKEVKDMLKGSKVSFLITAPHSNNFFHMEVQSQGPT